MIALHLPSSAFPDRLRPWLLQDVCSEVSWAAKSPCVTSCWSNIARVMQHASSMRGSATE